MKIDHSETMRGFPKTPDAIFEKKSEKCNKRYEMEVSKTTLGVDPARPLYNISDLS